MNQLHRSLLVLRRSRSLAVIVALAAIVAGALSVPAASGAAPTNSAKSGSGHKNVFTERCALSHEAPNDPIMMPGMTGMAMHHYFFGNVTTDASSTSATLLGKRTTCSTPADSSGYWIPVMYQHGRAVKPLHTLLYWRRPRNDHHAVHSLPAGLQMVAGNAMATQPSGHISWTCKGNGVTSADARGTHMPHNCPSGAKMKETIAFPECWDGHTLNAKNRTNVTYLVSNKVGCPDSHPVQIPQILFHVIWPIHSASGIRLSLTPHTTASAASAHADFLDGWKQSVINRDVQVCLVTQVRCGGVRELDAHFGGSSPK